MAATLCPTHSTNENRRYSRFIERRNQVKYIGYSLIISTYAGEIITSALWRKQFKHMRLNGPRLGKTRTPFTGDATLRLWNQMNG